MTEGVLTFPLYTHEVTFNLTVEAFDIFDVESFLPQDLHVVVITPSFDMVAFVVTVLTFAACLHSGFVFAVRTADLASLYTL